MSASASAVAGSDRVMTKRRAAAGTVLLASWLPGSQARKARSRRRGWRWSWRTTPSMPITADNTDENTRAQLARVNFLRDEPGGRRFFVNDLNGPLYILDKQTKTVHDLSRFQRRRRTAGPVPEIHVRAQFRDRPHQLHLRSRLRAQRRVLHDPHGGSGQSPRRRRRRPASVAGPRSVRLHDHAGNPDADAWTDRSSAKSC